MNNKLKALRERIGISQLEVANANNMNRVQYNQYENNYTTTPIKHLVSLADYYKVSVDYLLDFTDKKFYHSMVPANKIKSGERIKEFRKENKLTQKDLANFLNTTFSSIAWNEKGRNFIATPFLIMICSKYKISADYLLGKIDRKITLK